MSGLQANTIHGGRFLIAYDSTLCIGLRIGVAWLLTLCVGPEMLVASSLTLCRRFEMVDALHLHSADTRLQSIIHLVERDTHRIKSQKDR